MTDEFKYEVIPGWLEEHLDEESQALIDSLTSEVLAADARVAEFETIVGSLTTDEEEIPTAVMYRGMRDYQRSLVQRMRLNHQVNLAAQGLILDALWDEK